MICLSSPPAEYDARVLAEIKTLAAKNFSRDGVPFFDESELESCFDPACFYITEDALVIYYQLYTIGPYAAGTPEFSIPRTALEDILIAW
jgi:hypothetical protein